MGNLLRLAVFILVLGALVAATGTMLLQERHRQHALERQLLGERYFDAHEVVDVVRLHHAHTQRAILLFSGLVALCVVAIAILPGRRHAPDPAPGRLAEARTEMRGLETLARATAAQRAELDQEREARHRSEQDLLLQQVLANRALQEKVRLGRDLHDGLVQNLYAAGLVIEAAKQRVRAPEAVPPLLERATTTLNDAIRQARSMIGELTPDAIETQGFAESAETLLDHLDAAGRLETRALRISPALPAFVDPVRTELLQILRESVSNALRHGQATALEIDFTPLPDGRLQLRVRDNGRGFDPAAATRGHGLDNLAARARALGALLEIDSAPGKGATITLTLAAPAPPAPAV